ncbi:PAS domain S-box protein [Pseudomonas aeruginosa]|nr:PAS domain S-box protein [Pseudomonas aeruginosa]ELF6912340.1 PAS domain S-box protein [Pseudomonas aeruginosa]HBO1204650.1 PAS domain S-box protein [Pseudomonas aeruginosa]HEJ9850952.1 PAS domain S-box protein [Pseudomonas aeruginosa]
MEFAGRAGVFRKVGQVPGASQRAAGRRSSYYLAGCALQPGSSSRRVNTSMKTTRKPKVPLNQATRNRLLDEAVDDYAIHTLDSAGRIASWSVGAARLFGHDASEILGRDYACFHTRKDRDAGVPQQALRQADAEGRFETEGWRVRSNGKRFWAQVVIDAIRDSQGRLLGFAQLVHDLSEGRAAKEALRRSQEQFRLLVQSVTDYAIYMLDHRGRITNWNLGAQRIKGYLPEEVIGRHFSCFYTPEDREAGEPARGLAAAEREGRFEKEGWRVRKDGSRFWANVVIDPIRDSDGRLIGFAKVTRDITHRIEAERELERARQELFQAQKMESLGHLTGGVAHDFNNLLTVIIGSLGLLKKRLPGDQRTADLLQNALEAAQRGANLTQRMLSFARKQRLDPQPCAIPDLLRGMTDLLIHSLGPSVSIETRFPLDLDLGLTDANQLELSIINLATNARDAMPNGGRIVFSASNQRVPADNPHRLAPGNYICLSISDTGSGMDEETLRRAVEPFYTTKGVGRGTGLGLSIVDGLAEQLGGRLTLESQPGVGTTANIWIPAVPRTPESARTGNGATPQAPSESERVRLSCRVLVVDDDPLVLNNTAAMLEDLGCSVLKADSGSLALEILTATPELDILLTDQAMPRMNGSQLVERVMAQGRPLKMALATGFAEKIEGAAAQLPKLAKPFGQEELYLFLTGTLKAG